MATTIKAAVGVLVLCLALTSCASVKRHPMLYGIATGVAVGVTIVIIEKRGHCPGEYASGDPPCFNQGTGKR